MFKELPIIAMLEIRGSKRARCRRRSRPSARHSAAQCRIYWHVCAGDLEFHHVCPLSLFPFRRKCQLSRVCRKGDMRAFARQQSWISQVHCIYSKCPASCPTSRPLEQRDHSSTRSLSQANAFPSLSKLSNRELEHQISLRYCGCSYDLWQLYSTSDRVGGQQQSISRGDPRPRCNTRPWLYLRQSHRLARAHVLPRYDGRACKERTGIEANRTGTRA
ncbi:hypothetical protein ACQKWADRAFT_81170 [Trichoderma austrokoningii]